MSVHMCTEIIIDIKSLSVTLASVFFNDLLMPGEGGDDGGRPRGVRREGRGQPAVGGGAAVVRLDARLHGEEPDVLQGRRPRGRLRAEGRHPGGRTGKKSGNLLRAL